VTPRLAIAVGIVLAASAVTPAAADAAPTISLAPVPTSVFVYDPVFLRATVAPDTASGSVTFEDSTDGGTTWRTLAGGNAYGAGVFAASPSAPGTPETWELRAHFSGTGGTADAYSDAATQTITLHPETLSGFTVSSTLPGASPLRLTVDLACMDHGAMGQLFFEEGVDGSWTQLATGTLGYDYPGTTAGGGYATIAGRFAAGVHHLRARYTGDPICAAGQQDLDVDVEPVSEPLVLAGDAQVVELHHSVVIGAYFANVVPGFPPTGTLTIRRDGSIVATGPGQTLDVPFAPAALGTYVFTAEYSGDADYQPATSAPLTETVVPDVVDATAAALRYTTFYPYRDSYRDSTTARGTRREAVSVAFAVRNSAGKVVRTGSVAPGTGAYSWSWNGRTSAGTMVPAGRYTITSTLRDAAGTVKSVRQSVVVSSKRLYWYSTDLHKAASQYQKKAASWGAWLFYMPSGVAYKLRLYVYGNASPSMEPSGFAAHDTRECSFSTISPDCTRTEFRMSITNAWYSGALSPTYNRSGRYARAYVWAGTLGSVKVYKLRLHVSYALLK